MIEQEFRNSPVDYNNSFQAQKGYPGNDILQQATLKKGEIIVALELANGGGNYFLTLEEFKKRNLDSAALCQDVQVAPWVNLNKKENPNRVGVYKPTAKLYYINKDIEVAKGKATENCQYGKGGATQLVIPYAQKDIKDLYDRKISIEDASIVPFDVKGNIDVHWYINTELYKKIEDSCAQELKEVKELFKDNINDKGYIDLNNKEITPEAAKLIKARTNLQTSQIVYNSLLKELISELSKPNIDKEFVDLLYNDIGKTKEDINENIYKLNVSIDIIKDKSENIIDVRKGFLIDTKNPISDNIREQTMYLNSKLNSVEQALNSSYKLEFDIAENKVDFGLNQKMEFDIDRCYGNIIAETDIRNEDFEPRKQVHRQSAPMEKIELLSAYKQKEDLQGELLQQANKIGCKDYIEMSIKRLNDEIYKLEEKIAGKKDVYSENMIDYKLSYMREKTNSDMQVVAQGNQFNDNIESNIKSYLEPIHDKYDIDPLKNHKEDLVMAYKDMELLVSIESMNKIDGKTENHQLESYIQDAQGKCKEKIEFIESRIKMGEINGVGKKVNEADKEKYIEINYLKEKIDNIRSKELKYPFINDDKKEVDTIVDNDYNSNQSKKGDLKELYDAKNKECIINDEIKKIEGNISKSSNTRLHEKIKAINQIQELKKDKVRNNLVMQKIIGDKKLEVVKNINKNNKSKMER